MKRLQGGLAIDLSGLNSISLDLDAETITVGGGVREGDIVPHVKNAGREIR
jgi:FAD/FMN-containing dehydrogenase